MSKEKNNLDDMFKDAFEHWESPPKEGFFDEISSELHHSEIDELFKNEFSQKEVAPPQKAWTEIQQHLPLNLWLKRRLSQLSMIAGVVIVGMIAILYFNHDSKTPPIEEEKLPLPIDVEIANDDIQEAPKEDFFEADEPVQNTLATDNSLNQKLKSVELNKEDEIELNIDEEKIRAMLEPIQPLPIDSAVAKIHQKNHIEKGINGDFIIIDVPMIDDEK